MRRLAFCAVACQAGQTLTEYALVMLLVALTAMVAVGMLGTSVSGLLSSVVVAWP